MGYRVDLRRSNERQARDHAPKKKADVQQKRVARSPERAARLVNHYGDEEFCKHNLNSHTEPDFLSQPDSTLDDSTTLPKLASETAIDAWRERIVNSALSFARASDVTHGMMPRFGAI